MSNMLWQTNLGPKEVSFGSVFIIILILKLFPFPFLEDAMSSNAYSLRMLCPVMHMMLFYNTSKQTSA